MKATRMLNSMDIIRGDIEGTDTCNNNYLKIDIWLIMVIQNI